MHLGGAAGEVEGGDVGGLEPVDGAIEILGGDELFAVGAGVHVTVDAGDVAKFAEVELEDRRFETGEGQSVVGELLVERVFRLGGSAHEIFTGDKERKETRLDNFNAESQRSRSERRDFLERGFGWIF